MDSIFPFYILRPLLMATQVAICSETERVFRRIYGVLDRDY